mmetsp:Transcript_99212/g.319759  ORF Transcript_99212/g.319759 Transcript_99212/m.319759 type:complete len:250 (+) Transcript_99212:96-845(+)|eukprot:CAMPEP_0203937842 /NCGR_PEP_ID=MMETSP0359-20131031/75002_1 /ASSEMBLY_ACC=CAM_ASM_000338 /TAXON_ID=268821 /ORGANISM="Scrippsiella Hangoei, Strain SHTV-5" /LENGTH=249 /DNA_ID=CAMNT_0050867973 /DNA_START=58 /DNA_END=807 /DNA_ORIENTATION=-
MKVFVRNAVSGGSSQEFKVKASQQVHDLQGLVGLASLRSADDVRLLRDDEILEEWQSLQAAGVSDGAELSYVLLNVEPDHEFEEMVTRIKHRSPTVGGFGVSVLDLEAECGASFPDSLKTYLKLTKAIMCVGDQCGWICKAVSGVLYIGSDDGGDGSEWWFVDLNNTLGEGASSIWHGHGADDYPPMDFWVGHNRCYLAATDIKDLVSKFFEDDFHGRPDLWDSLDSEDDSSDYSDSEDDFHGRPDLYD